MDYTTMADEFMRNMARLRGFKPHKHISDSMHGEHFVLHFLAHHDGHALPGEIGAEMGISSARIAATLNSLEGKGFITRQIDPSDRRRILVGLTPEGRTRSEAQYKVLLDNIAGLLSRLGEHDAREYVRITARLADIASGPHEQPE